MSHHEPEQILVGTALGTPIEVSRRLFPKFVGLVVIGGDCSHEERSFNPPNPQFAFKF
jgi:hypothetical protein